MREWLVPLLVFLGVITIVGVIGFTEHTQQKFRRAFIAQECNDVSGRDYDGCVSKALHNVRRDAAQLDNQQGVTNGSIYE